MPPAARLTDFHQCAMMDPSVPPIPHVGGPILGPGVPQVLIAGLPAAVLGALAASAAEKPQSVRVVQQPDRVIVRKRTVVDFGDVTVEGELIKPEGSYVLNRNKTRFEPLIQLRDDFDAELRKSADNL